MNGQIKCSVSDQSSNVQRTHLAPCHFFARLGFYCERWTHCAGETTPHLAAAMTVGRGHSPLLPRISGRICRFKF